MENPCQTSASLATQGETNSCQSIGQGKGLSFPLVYDGWQAFAENTPRTSWVSTAEAADMQPEEHGTIAAGEVLDGAAVVAMKMSRAVGTPGTAGGACARDQINDGPIIVGLDREYAEGGEVRQEVGGEGHGQTPG